MVPPVLQASAPPTTPVLRDRATVPAFPAVAADAEAKLAVAATASIGPAAAAFDLQRLLTRGPLRLPFMRRQRRQCHLRLPPAA